MFLSFKTKKFAKVLEGEGEGVYAYVSGVCVYVGVGRRPMRSSVILFVNYFFHFFLRAVNLRLEVHFTFTLGIH